MSSRKKILAGNWKMNHGPKETQTFFEAIAQAPKAKAGTEFQLYVPAVSFSAALERASKLDVKVGAQNAHWEMKGAFTGELSGPLLKEVGIQHVLTGHSERRQYFGETDETAAKRTYSLLNQGFQVLACVGETRAEREAGQTINVLRRQVMALFQNGQQDCSIFLDGRLSLAYEPVWAIGTGLTATPEQAQDAHEYIRELLMKDIGADASQKTSILYGGSVTPVNFESLLNCVDIDGGLVGGASLKPQDWLKLAEMIHT